MLPLTRNPDDMNGDDNDNEHDQLPSVDEIRMASSRSSSRGPSSSQKCRVGRCGEVGIIAIIAILIVTVIGLSIGVAKRGDQVEAANTSTTTGSNAPREPREDEVQQWLFANGVSSWEDMEEQGSAHKFAVLWIADTDPLNLPLPDSVASAEGMRFVSRYVAALLYFALNGSNWDYQLSFLSAKDVCEWNDIFVASEGVQGRFFRIGLACNNGIVNTFQMPGINMQGTIPTEISFLSNLRVIALNSNKIQGTIPQGFQKMTDLDYVALQQNEFVGALPAWLGDLTNIRVFGVGDNDLDGTLPETLSQLTQLITLGLDNNKFSGKITSQLQSMTLLRRLYLEGNEFVDTLDTVFGDMTDLEELDVSSNRLEGTIPVDLLRLSMLRILDLHANELDGPIPSDIPSNPVLNYLALQDNLLTGEIPSGIAFLNNLTHLDLSSNVFGGEIPTRLSELVNLKYLFLGSNELTPGPIPSWIGNLTKLQDVSLRETGRFSAIATEFGLLKNLILLDLHNNGLTERVPRQLGELPNLRFLILSRNQLTGAVPAEFELLTSLEMLMLNGNDFTGSVDGICSKGIVPSVFVADCNGEVTCTCCSTCCVDTDDACNEMQSIVSLDPIWENSFERKFYEFGSELIFDGRL